MDIEWIKSGEGVIAVVIRASVAPEATTFITPNSFDQQVGFVVYPAGGQIQRHYHLPVERQLIGTSETLVVKRGRLEVDLYDRALQHVATQTLVAGDVLVLVSGGHGFRMLEDTILLEIKQGPYTGLVEKERF